MLNLLLVDDDILILNGLRQMIPWNDYDINVVACATNGEEAIELLHEQNIHIVITDIQMPFMNGMALTAYLNEHYPHIKIVLLSGYQEFDYAREALRLGVKDYLLKPVNEEDLITLIIRLRNEIRLDMERKKLTNDSFNITRLDFLKQLIKGNINRDAGLLLKKYNVDIEPAYNVSVIKCNDYYNTSYHNRFMEGSLLKFSVRNIAEELLSKSKHIVFEHEKDEIIIIFINPSKQIDFFNQLIEYCSLYLNTNIRIGLSKNKGQHQSIHEAYLECLDTFEFIRHKTALPIVSFEDIASLDRHFTEELNHFTKALKELMMTPNPCQGLPEVFDQLHCSLSKHQHIHIEQLQLLYTHIAIEGLRIIYNTKASEQSDQGVKLNQHIMQLKTLKYFDDFYASSKTFITESLKLFVSHKGSQQSIYMNKVTEYIQENYSNESLRLKEVAEHIHVNPSYLSILFKKNLNTSFSDYLLETRMKEAIQRLQNSTQRIFEISDHVGFSNAQYFSVCFKNYTGLTPKEYRSKAQQ